MSNLPHPSGILDPKIVSLMRKDAPDAEKNGKFTKAQLNLIHDQKWLKMLAPARYGGLELSLPAILEKEEALAWADGSIGWMVTLCAGSGWFNGFIDPELAKKILSDPKVCMAGSGGKMGTAEKTKAGYTVTGEWAHACGANQATVFTANCTVTQGGKPVKDENDKNKVLSFVLFKDEVTIIPAWNTIGMVATGSDGFKVTGLKVTEDRAFVINNDTTGIDAPLYNYPFTPLAEATMAVNISGMALHFTDLCTTLFNEKKNRSNQLLINDLGVQETLEKYTARLEDARMKLYYAVSLSWDACKNNKRIKEAIIYKVSAGAQELAKRARECVDALYPYCGLFAAGKDTEINRVWRDLHTASQHTLLVFGGSPE